MEDLVDSNTFELIYGSSDMPTYLHYNGSGTNPDLILASRNIADKAKREIIYNPGSGHHMIVTSFYIKGSIP